MGIGEPTIENRRVGRRDHFVRVSPPMVSGSQFWITCEDPHEDSPVVMAQISARERT